jgi:hypothetical protein
MWFEMSHVHFVGGGRIIVSDMRSGIVGCVRNRILGYGMMRTVT